MVLVVSKIVAGEVRSVLEENGETVFTIGKLVSREKEGCILQNMETMDVMITAASTADQPRKVAIIKPQMSTTAGKGGAEKTCFSRLLALKTRDNTQER